MLAPLTPGKSAIAAGEALAEGTLTFVPPSGGENSWRSFKLAFALPWRRFSGDSVLVFKVGLSQGHPCVSKYVSNTINASQDTIKYEILIRNTSLKASKLRLASPKL